MPARGEGRKCQSVHFSRIIVSGRRPMGSACAWKPKTVAQCCRAGVPRGAGSSRSATRESFVTEQPTRAARQGLSLPKRVRILRSADFRRVYQEGFRVTGPYFSAFCLAGNEKDGPRVGFTTPRAVGKAVVRNRIRRRMRESVRRHLDQLGPEFSVVFNPRKSVLTAVFTDLEREVERLFSRCKAS